MLKQSSVPVLTTRDAAHRSGRSRYFTGLPCKHGHICERFVCNSGCVDCVNRKRTVIRPAPNTLVLEIPVYEAMPGEFLVELKGLINSWIDHVMRERGYRKDLTIDIKEWVKR